MVLQEVSSTSLEFLHMQDLLLRPMLPEHHSCLEVGHASPNSISGLLSLETLVAIGVLQGLWQKVPRSKNSLAEGQNLSVN